MENVNVIITLQNNGTQRIALPPEDADKLMNALINDEEWLTWTVIEKKLFRDASINRHRWRTHTQKFAIRSTEVRNLLIDSYEDEQ